MIFFFQAEDGIRDRFVTGVQTCALPIYLVARREERLAQVGRACEAKGARRVVVRSHDLSIEIGRAPCRERV